MFVIVSCLHIRPGVIAAPSMQPLKTGDRPWAVNQAVKGRVEKYSRFVGSSLSAGTCDPKKSAFSDFGVRFFTPKRPSPNISKTVVTPSEPSQNISSTVATPSRRPFTISKLDQTPLGRSENISKGDVTPS
jgi:hypothetical protein